MLGKHCVEQKKYHIQEYFTTLNTFNFSKFLWSRDFYSHFTCKENWGWKEILRKWMDVVGIIKTIHVLYSEERKSELCSSPAPHTLFDLREQEKGTWETSCCLFPSLFWLGSTLKSLEAFKVLTLGFLSAEPGDTP